MMPVVAGLTPSAADGGKCSLALHDPGKLERVTDLGLGEACAFGDLGLRRPAAELRAELTDAADDQLKVFLASRLFAGFDGPTCSFERADHGIDIDVRDCSRADRIADLI